MDNIVKNIKTYGELEQYARVNGYGPNSLAKLIEAWNNKDVEPVPEIAEPTTEDEY